MASNDGAFKIQDLLTGWEGVTSHDLITGWVPWFLRCACVLAITMVFVCGVSLSEEWAMTLLVALAVILL
jgi:hypothetical protein